MLENVAAAVWLALLIVFGSFVLMRGTVGCAKIASMPTVGWERADRNPGERGRFAEHLKNSRRW